MSEQIQLTWDPFKALSIDIVGLRLIKTYSSLDWYLFDPKTGGKIGPYAFSKILNCIKFLTDQNGVSEKIEQINDFYIQREQLFCQIRSKLSHHTENQIIGGVTLSPSGFCSGGCAYCYARRRFRKQVTSRETNIEVIKKTFEFIRTSSIIRERCGITLGGGGDPVENFDLYLKVVKMSKIYQERYGIFIPIYIATLEPSFLREEMIDTILENQDWITISVDGDPNNTYHRPRLDYTYLIKRYGLRCKWAASAVFTAKTVPLIMHNYEYLIDAGFDAIQMRPVRLPPNHPLLLKQKDFELAASQYHEVLQNMEHQNTLIDFICKLTTVDTLGRFFLINLMESKVACRCASGGGGGFGALFVDSQGHLYPCPSTTFEIVHLGDVHTGDINLDILHGLHQKPDECNHCQIINVCGGPCVFESLLISGLPNHANPSTCQFQKDISSMVIDSLTTLFKTRPDSLTSLLNSFAMKAFGLC